nr:MAG TPA: hypothetical protein [Caudoviricetes sp.]
MKYHKSIIFKLLISFLNLSNQYLKIGRINVKVKIIGFSDQKIQLKAMISFEKPSISK